MNKAKLVVLVFVLSVIESNGKSVFSERVKDSSTILISWTRPDTILTLYKDSTFVFYKCNEEDVDFCSGFWYSTKIGYQLKANVDSFWENLDHLPAGSKQPKYFPVIMNLEFVEQKKQYELEVWYHCDCFSESKEELENSTFQFKSEESYDLADAAIVYPFLKGRIVEVDKRFGKSTITIDHIYYQARYTNLRSAHVSVGDYVGPNTSMGKASANSVARLTICDSSFSWCNEYR